MKGNKKAWVLNLCTISVGKGIHEEIVASYAFSILSALAFLSSNRVVHRNMCLENVLVTDEIVLI